MKTIRLLPIICAALLAITGCKKKASDDPSPMVNTASTGSTGPTGSTGATGSTGSTGVVKVIKTKVDPGIYLVGYKSMVNFPIDPRAVIWKDNNPTVLSTFSSAATAMCVQDTNIYVAGTEYTTEFASNAVYWVNKQIWRLTFYSNFERASAVGIGVVGKDVYVAGNIPAGAVYWKNGDMVLLPGTSSRVTGMVVKGNDIYICGSTAIETPSHRTVACYWKNGVLQATDDNVYGSDATAVAVDDNGDVYLSGSTAGTLTPRAGGVPRPAFWKNNALTVLQINMPYATTTGIAVDGGNVYVSGTANDGNLRGEILNPRGVLWKNGTPEYLGTSLWNSLSGGPVTAVQGEVYVAGSRPIAPLTAYGVVFKDGVILSQGSGTVFNNIYVIK